MKEIFYTTAGLAKKFKVRPSYIQYLRNEELIPSIRRGKGYSTEYPHEAVEIIKSRLKNRLINANAKSRN